MATIDEAFMLRHLEYLRRGMLVLAGEGTLDERDIGVLIDGTLEATSDEPASPVHLMLLRIESEVNDAREAYEASVLRDGTEDNDDG